MNIGYCVTEMMDGVDLEKLIPCPEAVATLGVANARRLGVLPVATWSEDEERVLLMAYADTFDSSQLERVAKYIDPIYDVHFFKYPVHLLNQAIDECYSCLLYTSPSPRDRQKSRMPSSA